MARKGKAEVEITGKDSTKKGLNKTKNSLKRFAASAKRIIAGVATGLLGIGVASVVVGRQLFELGSAAAETESKFKAVFGTASDAVNAFGEDFRKVAGLTTQETQAILANAGAIAQGLGFATEASGLLATQVVTLAGDLASFNNLPTDRVAQIISKALTGETESLKGLGIVVKQLDIQQRALIDTGKTSVSQLTDQEKATATLALVTERAGAAVGDLDRTQESAANQARQVAADFRQLKDEIATGLTPALADLLPLIRSIIVNLGFLSNAILDTLGLTNSAATNQLIAIKRNFKTIEDLENRAALERRNRLALQDRIAGSSLRIRRELQEQIETSLLVEEGIFTISGQVEAAELARAAALIARTDAQNLANAASERQAEIDATLSRARTGATGGIRDVDGAAPGIRGPGTLPGQIQPPSTEGLSGTSSALLDFRLGFFEATEQLGEFETQTRSVEEALGSLAGGALVNFQDGFVEAFEAIGTGEAVFASLGKAVKRSLADAATSEAKIEVARGVAKLAAGLFPPNPAAFASAAQHFAAAALFGAAAGAIGGTRQAQPGGGGVGGRGPISDSSIQQVQGVGGLPPSKLIIQGSLLDMSDPAQADALGEALSTLAGRRIIVGGDE